MAEHESLVTVATFTTVGEAEAARLMLESRGITCALSDAETVTMAWVISNAVGGVKVQVPESDAPRASKILAQRAARRVSHDADDYGLDRSAPRPAANGHANDLEEALAPPDPEEANDTVDRAWRAALLGFLLPVVLHLYSLWLVFQLPWIQSRVSRDRRGRLIGTLLLDGLAMIGVMALLQLGLP